jgi:hypothetical protein
LGNAFYYRCPHEFDLSWSNVTESGYVPERGKICYEDIFYDSEASVQTPNPAFAMPLLSFQERRTIRIEVENLTNRQKGVDGEVPHVRFRNSE